MLTTEKASRLYSTYKNTLELSKIGETVFLGTHSKFQHLYILSDEEIKEGDWYFNNDKIAKCERFSTRKALIFDSNREASYSTDCSKVIASTDKSIHGTNDLNVKISQHIHGLSQGFIEKYIKMYNLGTPIVDIMVEYDEYAVPLSYEQFMNNEQDFMYKLRVRPDNTIITHPVEVKTYTENEMLAIYEVGRADALLSHKLGKYIDSSKDLINKLKTKILKKTEDTSLNWLIVVALLAIYTFIIL